MSSIIRATTTSGLQVAPDNSGSLQLQTNGTTAAVTIDTSQNVGIGTTSPTQKLDVNGAVNSQRIYINNPSNDSVIEFVNSGTRKSYLRDFGSGFNIVEEAAQPIILHTNNTERMRIDSSGNVGIGTTSPNEKLEVNGNIYLNNGNADGAQITFASNGFSAWNIDNFSGALRCYYGSTEYFRLSTTGTITSQPTYDNTAAGSTVVVTSAGLVRRTSSSLKYKKDVETLEQTIVDNAVNNLRPVWYRTKNAEGDDKATWSHIGLIAEEVDLVEPRLVKYRTAEVTQDENGANVTTELETPVPEDVDYAKLSVILLAKIKQLEARIAVLEAK